MGLKGLTMMRRGKEMRFMMAQQLQQTPLLGSV